MSAGYTLRLKMPRKRITYTIDERIGDLIAKLAKLENVSRNRYLENHFANVGIRTGLLPADFEPLGETRGGDRTKSKQEEELDNPNLGDAQD